MPSHAVVKDPNFPLRHTLITELKNNTKQLVEDVAQADVMVTRNGQTLCYMVNPAHYEAMVAALVEAGGLATQAFLAAKQQGEGGLEALDASYLAARQGRVASAAEVAQVFGT